MGTRVSWFQLPLDESTDPWRGVMVLSHLGNCSFSCHYQPHCHCVAVGARYQPQYYSPGIFWGLPHHTAGLPGKAGGLAQPSGSQTGTYIISSGGLVNHRLLDPPPIFNSVHLERLKIYISYKSPGEVDDTGPGTTL